MPPKGLPRGLPYGGGAEDAACVTKLLRIRPLT